MRWYVSGLLSEVERNNGWTLAEAAGDAGPEGMQRLSNFYAWDTDGLRDDVRAAVVEAIGAARRSVSDPSDIAYYICFGPADTILQRLVGVVGARWAVEECFQTAKDETGLDRYQVRGYQAWYRHVTLSMTALAVSLITREIAKKGNPHPAPTTR